MFNARAEINRICKEILARYEAGERFDDGICNLMDEEKSTHGLSEWALVIMERSELFISWEHFSGNALYPVPADYDNMRHYQQFNFSLARRSLWLNTQGRLRLNLLSHLINQTN